MTPIVVGILVWALIVLIAAFIAIIGCAFENLNNKKLSCLGTYMVQIAQIILTGCILFIFAFLIFTLILILFSIFGGLV
jgi:hypothetical protein